MLRDMLRLFVGFVLTLPLLAGDLQVGVGRIKITPERPIFLSGYAARKKPSEGVKMDIWAKALAFSDKRNGRVVIVTTDLIGMSRSISERVGAEVEKKYGLRRAQLMINSSHTHSGPAVRDNLDSMFDLTPEQRQVIVEQFEGVGPKDTFTREEMLNAIRETAWGMNKHYLTTHWAALAMLVGGFLVAETKKENGGK